MKETDDLTAFTIKSLLVISASSQVVSRFPPILWRDCFDVAIVDNPRLAIKAVEKREFSLIITGFPVPNIEYQRLLDEIRAFGSPCRKTPVVAVVRPVDRPQAETFIGRGLNRIAFLSDSDTDLATVVASVLNVAPRVAVRIPIGLEAELRSHGRRMVAQTINVSRSGMLITDPGNLEPGDRFSFSFEAFRGRGQIEGTAEVVRVDRRRPSAASIGARFVDFDAGCDQVLEASIGEALGAG